MKRTVTIVNIAFLVAVLIAQTQVFAHSVANELDSAITAYVKHNKFSGSVLVASKGTILLSKGYGKANYELDVPNTPQTKFRLGSLTKQFTATAILQLCERGQLRLSEPLSTFLPTYPSGSSITVRHLLNHTSGIANYTAIEPNTAVWRKAVTLPDLIARFRDIPLAFSPGTEFQYSNSNYVLLTYIIEKVSGMSYEAYMKTHIFEPAGMTNSGYDHAAVLLPYRATGYALDDGALVNAEFIDMSVPSGAGGLYSTTEDLYKWDRALYTETLLKKSSIDSMLTPGLGNYGFGWLVSKQGRKQAQHGGGVHGFATFIARYLNDDVCVIALSNYQHGESGSLAGALASIVFSEPYSLPAERRESTVDRAALARCTGEYELVPGFVLTVTPADGYLNVQATGQQQLEFYPESERRYFCKLVDAQIEFTADNAGTVNGLILYQNGRSLPGKKKQ